MTTVYFDNLNRGIATVHMTHGEYATLSAEAKAKGMTKAQTLNTRVIDALNEMEDDRKYMDYVFNPFSKRF